ncbi:MAG: hypothetical protein F6K04_20720 [Leptolyngbya sp. SIO4C5]|nr:hypothetical protein [Leptolyngbya sp. SIO4C5]
MKPCLPTRLVLRVATQRKTLLLTAYTKQPQAIADWLRDRLQQEGGEVTAHIDDCPARKTPSFLIGAQLASFTSADIWQIRSTLQLAGAAIETVHVDYGEGVTADTDIARPVTSVNQHR